MVMLFPVILEDTPPHPGVGYTMILNTTYAPFVSQFMFLILFCCHYGVNIWNRVEHDACFHQ